MFTHAGNKPRRNYTFLFHFPEAVSLSAQVSSKQVLLFVSAVNLFINIFPPERRRRSPARSFMRGVFFFFFFSFQRSVGRRDSENEINRRNATKATRREGPESSLTKIVKNRADRLHAVYSPLCVDPSTRHRTFP